MLDEATVQLALWTGNGNTMPAQRIQVIETAETTGELMEGLVVDEPTPFVLFDRMVEWPCLVEVAFIGEQTICWW